MWGSRNAYGRIQTDCLARIVGAQAGNKLDMLVPPAGWLEPAVSVTDMLTFALIEAGHDPAEAKSVASAEQLVRRAPPMQVELQLTSTIGCLLH